MTKLLNKYPSLHKKMKGEENLDMREVRKYGQSMYA